MPYISTILYQEASGELKKVYDSVVKSRGRLANIHTIHSLNPQSLVWHMDLYMGVMFGESPLNRAQREMMAVIVSSVNNCEYCTDHHSKALLHFWKDEKKINRLSKNYKLTELAQEEDALCEFAEILTMTPDSEEIPDYIEKLKKLAFSERAVLDATMVIGYFNFVNRMVLALGVEKEPDTGGYKYDS